GTGLLLARVAPYCEDYFATDISSVALSTVAQLVEANGLSHVRLAKRAAHDAAGIARGSFDTVIVNSVAQYFPTVSYLLSVLEVLVGAVARGGRVLLGDVRSLPLLQAFHAGIQLVNAGDSLTVEALRERITVQTAQEKELLIHPELFRRLSVVMPRIRSV